MKNFLQHKLILQLVALQLNILSSIQFQSTQLVIVRLRDSCCLVVMIIQYWDAQVLLKRKNLIFISKWMRSELILNQELIIHIRRLHFHSGNELNPATTYTLQVKDDDGGLAGSDDNCGSFDFEGDDVGIFTLTAGSHEVELGISHPVISYTFYDTITVYPSVEIPAITITGILFFAVMIVPKLSTEFISGLQYQWLKDGLPIPGADSTEYTVYVSGVYSLTATGEGGCFANSTETIIEVFEMPADPNIYLIGNTLNTSTTWDIQWYYNGDPIPGANENTYSPAIEGTYMVSASNGPCVAYSEDIIFEFQSIDEIATINGFKAFPNPNNGNFTYQFILTETQSVEITLLNLIGEILNYDIYQNLTGTISKSISIEDYPPGIYYLHATTNNYSATIKVIVQ